MKLVVWLVIVRAAVASTYNEDDDVLVLTRETFEQAVTEFPDILVEFYSPSGGHCDALAPQYAKAAKTLKDEGSAIRLAKVDVTNEAELANNFEVRSNPTLKFIRAGKPSAYTGGKTAPEIVTWLRKRTGPTVMSLESVAAVETLTGKEDVSVVGFFKDQSSAGALAFTEVAVAMDDVLFGITSDATVFAEFKIAEQAVVLFKTFDGRRVDLTENLDAKSIKEFIVGNRSPLVREFTQESAVQLFGGDAKNHLLLFVSKTSEEFQAMYDAFKMVAPAFKGKVQFIYVNVDNDENLRVVEFCRINDSPTYRYIHLGEEMRMYKPDTRDVTVELVREFVQSIQDGRRQPAVEQSYDDRSYASERKGILGIRLTQEVVDADTTTSKKRLDRNLKVQDK